MHLVNPNRTGRRPNAKSLVTMETRAFFKMLVEANLSKLQDSWERVNEKDPAKAIDLILNLAEYFLPKLARIEHVGQDGKAIEYQITAPQIQQILKSYGNEGTAGSDQDRSTGATVRVLHGDAERLPAKLAPPSNR